MSSSIHFGRSYQKCHLGSDEVVYYLFYLFPRYMAIYILLLYNFLKFILYIEFVKFIFLKFLMVDPNYYSTDHNIWTDISFFISDTGHCILYIFSMSDQIMQFTISNCASFHRFVFHFEFLPLLFPSLRNSFTFLSFSNINHTKLNLPVNTALAP